MTIKQVTVKDQPDKHQLIQYSDNPIRINKNIKYKYPNLKIGVIVPAYNEEVSIVQCVKMLVNLDYPDYEVIVINDGSKDNTLKKLLNAFKLKQVELNQNNFINTKEIRSIKKSSDQKITVIDKENGGKADSINTGINYYYFEVK